MVKNLARSLRIYGLALLLVAIAAGAHLALADEFISPNFRVLDPVISSSGYGTSTSYQLWSTVSQVAIGTSTITDYSLGSGFLYFPFVSTPVVSATPGNAQVALSWTAASGALGWTVAGYNVGQSTVSGGPYTYSSSLGNVTSSTRTGLTNGAAYYFIIRAEDVFGNSIATSSEISTTPIAPASSSPSSVPTGGGGGGGGIAAPTAGVIFYGRAYPGSAVTLLKDAQIAAVTIAGPDARFKISLTGISPGSYVFSVYGADPAGRRSSAVSFPEVITAGASTEVGGIFLAPTIAVDKSEVKRGENIAIFGSAAPQADVVIAVNSDETLFARAKTDSDGAYLYDFDTALLNFGQHVTKSKTALGPEISPFGKTVSFTVGSKTTLASPPKAPLAKGDLNNDNRVNLIDFSVAAYWYKRPSPPAAIDLNGDGKVDLIDFSIMAFYWTG